MAWASVVSTLWCRYKSFQNQSLSLYVQLFHSLLLQRLHGSLCSCSWPVFLAVSGPGAVGAVKLVTGAASQIDVWCFRLQFSHPLELHLLAIIACSSSLKTRFFSSPRCGFLHCLFRSSRVRTWFIVRKHERSSQLSRLTLYLFFLVLFIILRCFIDSKWKKQILMIFLRKI